MADNTTATLTGTLVGPLPLGDEEWREYDLGTRVYRIPSPKALYYRQGGKTHRVVDTDGVVHCLPAPGADGCVLRWKNKAGAGPVQF
jgi:hypothetical protein